MTEPTDDTLRNWLLGELAPAEGEALEERLIADEDFAARLRAVETDLLDDLARGVLGGDERARAAAYFAATPRDRGRLRIARALAVVGAEANAATSSSGRGHAQSAQTHAGRPRRRWRAAAVALAGIAAIVVVGLRLFPGAPAAFTITLTDGQQRGAASIAIAVPKTAQEVRLQAEVDGDAGAHYLLAIDDTFAASGLPERKNGAYRFVETTVPAAALAAGAHRVRVVAEIGAPAEASWTLTTRNE